MKQLSGNPETPRNVLDDRLRALFEVALKGDESAYHLFLEEVSRIVRSFLLRSLSRQSFGDVEDLVQEVFIAIHNKRGLYKVGMPVLPWVKVITKHRLIDTIRSASRRPQFVAFDIDFEVAIEEEPPIALDTQGLLDTLEERQKQILCMAKIEELSYADIAHQMGMTISAVKVTVHRSLNILRKTLDEKK